MPRARRAGPGAVLAAALAVVAALAPAPTARAQAPADTAAPADTVRAPVRSADWDTLATGLPEAVRLNLLLGFRYNRVDGPVPGVGLGFYADDLPDPILFARFRYAFSRERALFEAGFEERVGRRPRVAFGGEIFRETATEDEWIVSELENTLFAILARTDYRDHYEAEGGRAHLVWNPGRDLSFRVTARAEEHRPLRTRTRVAAFGGDDLFRENPPAARGNDRAWTVAARFGPATLPVRGGANGEIEWERSGEPFSSDFDYGRLRAAARTTRRLGSRLEFRARVIAGSTRDGELPPQKIWHLGGIGTLRGHDYKVFHGDQFLLANAEPSVRLRKKSVYGFAFLDWGAAWFGSGNLDRQRPALDGGLGIRLLREMASIHVARDLKRGDAPYLVGVRLGGTF